MGNVGGEVAAIPANPYNFSAPRPYGAPTMVLPEFPHLARVMAAQVAHWPEHAAFLTKRVAEQAPAALIMADEIAGLVLELAGNGLDELCADYRWMCDRVMEEELHFRRTGNYRLSRFEDALREVYSDRVYMGRYMNGLLLSQVLWSNHSDAMRFYVDRFLGGTAAGARHLEIGPGHGLLLTLAARSGKMASITAWDVSEASIAATRHALTQLGVDQAVSIEKTDLFAMKHVPAAFDTLVISEVLEHLEDPLLALEKVRDCLAPGGRAFVNAPVNSPAADHLYLFRTPEEVVDLVRQAGLVPVETGFFPATGFTEAKARKQQAAISCAVIAAKR